MTSPLPQSIRDAAHKAAGCEEVGVGMECFTHSTDWTPEGCPVALETARAVMLETAKYLNAYVVPDSAQGSLIAWIEQYGGDQP